MLVSMNNSYTYQKEYLKTLNPKFRCNPGFELDERFYRKERKKCLLFRLVMFLKYL